MPYCRRGSRGLMLSRATLALTSDCPNLVPSPVSASAVADRVRFSLTGSIFSARPVTVSNRVLNSVVTLRASMTSALVMRVGVGFFGLDSETYLLPKTVVASMSASTLAGISLMYFGSTSRVELGGLLAVAAGWLELVLTRPISTPL